MPNEIFKPKKEGFFARWAKKKRFVKIKKLMDKQDRVKEEISKMAKLDLRDDKKLEIKDGKIVYKQQQEESKPQFPAGLNFPPELEEQQMPQQPAFVPGLQPQFNPQSMEQIYQQQEQIRQQHMQQQMPQQQMPQQIKQSIQDRMIAVTLKLIDDGELVLQVPLSQIDNFCKEVNEAIDSQSHCIIGDIVINCKHIVFYKIQ